MKKIIALVLALAMVATLGLAFAAGPAITITVTNNTEKAHTYYAYQIFSGNVETDGSGNEVLTNIDWGTGVTATSTIISELGSDYTGATSAADVARILGTLSNNATKVKAFANTIASHLVSSAASSAALNTTTHQAVITVPAVGYYLVKENENTTLDEGESFTKILLKIIHSQEIVAKDTHLTPEKKIVEGANKVDANNAAIGNDVEYEITLPIPNTLEYNRYKLEMNDTLSKGLTFKEITSIMVAGTEMILSDDAKTNKTSDGKITAEDLSSELEATNYFASLTALTGGAHKLSITFKDFKAKVEQTNNGTTTMKTGNVVIRYKATVNKDAIIATTGNPNTVDFDYSNNPNSNIENDKFGQNEPHGTTPDDTVKTYVTEFDIKKVDGTHNNSALAGAEFSFVGTEIDTELLTGTKFVASSHTLVTDEETYADSETYYKLVDGTYTTTSPETTGIDTSKYATPTTDTYRKINYTKKVLSSSDTDRTVWSGSDGYMKFTGLKANASGNHYTLTEVTAPAGYNKLTEPISITITWSAPAEGDDSTGGFTATASSTSTTYTVTQNATTGIFEISVQNNTGTTLPSTGGIGTTIFYILGGLLVIGAAVILVARRKAQD